MEMNEKLKNFLSSNALVIDDEIVDEKSTISAIVSKLEEQGTLFIKKRELLESIDSISNLAFIVLDWDLIKKEEKEHLPEGVSLGTTLLEDQKGKIRDFIKCVIEKYFIPVFIFTQENIDSIKECLEQEDIIKGAIDKNRVYISSKSNLKDDQVIVLLNDWLNNSVTVYTYKIMDEAIETAKHRFFNEMYTCDINWPCHVYQTLKQDAPADINSDFQEFLMTSFTSTIEPIEFDQDGFEKSVNLNESEMLKIYSKIKFFAYKNEWKIGPHTGDLYQLEDGTGDEFYINVSASCDMRGTNYYFVRGKTVEELEDKVCFYIVRKIIDRQAICFDFRNVKLLKPQQDCNMLCLGDKKNPKYYKRVGRLLSPYIDAFQEKFSHFIVRTGVLKDPET